MTTVNITASEPNKPSSPGSNPTPQQNQQPGSNPNQQQNQQPGNQNQQQGGTPSKDKPAQQK